MVLKMHVHRFKTIKKIESPYRKDYKFSMIWYFSGTTIILLSNGDYRVQEDDGHIRS